MLDEYIKENLNQKIQDQKNKINLQNTLPLIQKAVAALKKQAINQQELEQHKELVNQSEKDTIKAKSELSQIKKNTKRHKEKLEKLQQKKEEYEQDLIKVEAMKLDLIEQYIDETFYQKQK